MTPASIPEVTRVLTAPGAMFEMEERVIRGIPTRVWKRLPGTLRELVSHAGSYGERIFLVYEDERLSYAEAFARVAKLATYLQRDCGVTKGERVAVAMRNFPEWVISFYAAASIGAIVVPLNAWWKSNELSYGLHDSGTRVLICDEERAHLLSSALGSLPNVKHVLVARARETLSAGMVPFATALAAYPGVTALPEVAIDPEDDAT
ncbi:MAG TPA: AMP-binding protein, partial [Polyangiales bacterium]|nr:AMP-binding protein [Polyangiales bacterium]